MDAVLETITVTGAPGELRRLHRFLAEFWLRHGLPPADVMRVELGLEEVYANAVTHGAEGRDRDATTVTVDLRLSGRRLELTVEDAGPPFDPLTAPPPDLTATLDRRQPGGLGIHLVRKLMDDLRYERRDGHNRLLLVAYLEPEVPQEGW